MTMKLDYYLFNRIPLLFKSSFVANIRKANIDVQITGYEIFFINKLSNNYCLHHVVFEITSL